MTVIGLAPGPVTRAMSSGDGTELRYFVAGESGPHLVCVNALGQDLLVFSRLVEQLARDYRVVAWKPRGTFEPEQPVTTLWDQVSDLRRILDAESVRDCALVSWCSGAKVAIELARRAPESARSSSPTAPSRPTPGSSTPRPSSSRPFSSCARSWSTVRTW